MRELLWTSDEDNRRIHLVGLALFQDNLHKWKEIFRAVIWANYDILFARRRRQEALEETTPGFARKTVHKIWLSKSDSYGLSGRHIDQKGVRQGLGNEKRFAAQAWESF